MKLQLFAHPFSSYCQKVLIALYENATAFTFRLVSPEEKETSTQFAALWPMKRFPLLLDGERVVLESSTIIEYLMIHHAGSVPMLPQNPQLALEARMMDRCFDNYIMTPMQKIVGDRLRAEGEHDPRGVRDAESLLTTAYGWLNDVMQKRTWAAGDEFSVADCAAAPALLYADWVHEIAGEFPHVRTFRSRLLARPSVARAVDEARPFRPYFPGGAPTRD
jgi:glutathione S-transferase